MKNKTAHYQFVVSEETANKLDARVKASGITTNAFLKQLIESYLWEIETNAGQLRATNKTLPLL